MNGVNARGIRNPGARVGRVNGEKGGMKAGTRSGGETRGRLSYIQTIAAVFRQYQLAAAVLFHFLTQTVNMRFYGMGGYVRTVFPDIFKQILLAGRGGQILVQIFKNINFLFGQLCRFAGFGRYNLLFDGIKAVFLKIKAFLAADFRQKGFVPQGLQNPERANGFFITTSA